MKKPLIALIAWMVLLSAGSAESRWTREIGDRRMVGIALDLYYLATGRTPKTWEEFENAQRESGTAFWSSERGSLEEIKRRYVLVGESGVINSRKMEGELVAISLYPSVPPTMARTMKGEDEEEEEVDGEEKEAGIVAIPPPEKQWHIVWKSNKAMYPGMYVGEFTMHDAEMRSFSGWPEVEQKILARRAEIAAGPAGVAAPLPHENEIRDDDDEPEPAAGKPGRGPVRSIAAVSGAGAPRGWPLGPTAGLAAVVLALAGYLAWRRAH